MYTRFADSVVTTKAARINGAIRYKIEDKLAGYTTPGRTFRKDYKKATRHARRALNMNVRRGLFAD